MLRLNIGLVRHFKVKRGYPNKLVTPEEFMKWVEEYDLSDIEEEHVDLGNVEWENCLSSDLPRARKTAQKVFNGEIVVLKDLREISLSPIFKKNIRLPLFIHLLLIRLAWLCNHKSQKENKKQVLSRINHVIDMLIEENKNVLVVGHGGIMVFMRKELVKRGFSGPAFNRPNHALIYVFKK
ncbi:histidine phosphatase family protein [Cytobacillus sp. FJAT-54145]|uniref:Histidine phosphatase family protein n=1 Tax=Cytobacillus spartinae TaxID=3299023 RepID=A0ABW6KEL2_9BACI